MTEEGQYRACKESNHSETYYEIGWHELCVLVKCKRSHIGSSLENLMHLRDWGSNMRWTQGKSKALNRLKTWMQDSYERLNWKLAQSIESWFSQFETKKKRFIKGFPIKSLRELWISIVLWKWSWNSC